MEGNEYEDVTMNKDHQTLDTDFLSFCASVFVCLCVPESFAYHGYSRKERKEKFTNVNAKPCACVKRRACACVVRAGRACVTLHWCGALLGISPPREHCQQDSSRCALKPTAFLSSTACTECKDEHGWTRSERSIRLFD